MKMEHMVAFLLAAILVLTVFSAVKAENNWRVVARENFEQGSDCGSAHYFAADYIRTLRLGKENFRFHVARLKEWNNLLKSSAIQLGMSTKVAKKEDGERMMKLLKAMNGSVDNLIAYINKFCQDGHRLKGSEL